MNSTASLPACCRRYATLLGLAAILLWIPLRAEALSYAFEQSGRHYTFTAEFTVEATPERVFALLYPIDALRQYSRRGGTVELLEHGAAWQVVRLTHRGWFWTFSADVRRDVDCAGRCIHFRMLSARRTGFPFPVPTASEGEYRIEPVVGAVKVLFRQSVDAPDTVLLRPWIALAKNEAVALAYDLERFVQHGVAMAPQAENSSSGEPQ